MSAVPPEPEIRPALRHFGLVAAAVFPTHHARPRRRLGIRLSCRLEVVNLIQTPADRSAHCFGDRVAVARGPAPPSNLPNGTHPGVRTICPEAGRAKGSAMHAPLYDRRFSSIAMDDCPVCWGKIALALVEPHPVHEGREIHTYTCGKCGPTKSRIVVCPSNAAALQVAA
jgi:hypothetical protein